jgi:hypothetical protein
MGDIEANGTFKKPKWPAAAVSLGKDAVALFRDGALLIVALLLIVFPRTFNAILVDAGFEEGSVVGFKWKSKLVESDEALQRAQSTITELQNKNDELVAALGRVKTRPNDAQLEQQIDKLEDQNRRLKGSTQQVQAAVSQTIESNAPLVQKALAASTERPATARPKSDYLVGLQTVGVTDDDRKTINDKVAADGYGIDATSYSYPAGQRPSWFAPVSTVFFYAASAIPQARELAQFLKSATGQTFVVQRGAGLGVDPARRDVTLFVHYVKS